MRTFITAAATALALVPTAALAQSTSIGSMHGPPNTAGYDKDKGVAPAASDQAQPRDSGRMKGPPNANGMKSDESGK